MWFNKITGEYYVGSSYGGNRLSNYYTNYWLNKKTPIYRSLLNYGHKNHILFIMEDLGLISEFTHKELFEVEQIYIDWNFKINKELALNRHPIAKGGKVIVSKRIGSNNPMFGKKKSAEFIAWQKKDKRGENNPQFGVIKSEETLTKLRKKVYVYDSFTKNLLIEYKGTVECMKKHPIGKGTFAKYIDSGISFKGQLFYRLPRF
jgi:group I intron endonuclease